MQIVLQSLNANLSTSNWTFGKWVLYFSNNESNFQGKCIITANIWNDYYLEYNKTWQVFHWFLSQKINNYEAFRCCASMKIVMKMTKDNINLGGHYIGNPNLCIFALYFHNWQQNWKHFYGPFPIPMLSKILSYLMFEMLFMLDLCAVYFGCIAYLRFSKFQFVLLSVRAHKCMLHPSHRKIPWPGPYFRESKYVETKYLQQSILIPTLIHDVTPLSQQRGTFVPGKTETYDTLGNVPTLGRRQEEFLENMII